MVAGTGEAQAGGEEHRQRRGQLKAVRRMGLLWASIVHSLLSMSAVLACIQSHPLRRAPPLQPLTLLPPEHPCEP